MFSSGHDRYKGSSFFIVTILWLRFSNSEVTYSSVGIGGSLWMAVMSASAFFRLASYTSAPIWESSEQNPVMSSFCLQIIKRIFI